MSDKTFNQIAEETLKKLRPRLADNINQNQVKDYYELARQRVKWISALRDRDEMELQSGVLEEEPILKYE